MARHVLPLALAGVAVGILLADGGAAVPVAGLLAIGAVAVIAGGGLRAWPIGLVGVLLLGLGAGAWRLDAATPDPAGSVAILVDGAEHRLTGTVVDDPRPRADRLQLVVADVTSADGRSFQDRLLLWVPRGPDVAAGVRLAFDAELELAEDFDGFAYREYLARQGIGAIARPRSVEVAGDAGGVAGWMGGLRGTLHGGLVGLVPEPEAALGAGILLGVRSSIAPEIADDFAIAGLTHVVAISGWNIAIVAALVAAALRPLERRPGGKRTALIVAAAMVAGYVLLTGASPSVVRAALMAAALLLGRLAGSRAHGISALGLAALVMLLAAPSVLWDVGFQLSLLATAGLIWFGATFEARLTRWPAWIREPVALTMAAQVTTLPVILVNFERLSLVAPIANVLVVPIVPLAMAASALAAVAGVMVDALGQGVVGDAVGWLAGGLAWLVLRAMVVVGHLTASVPLAAVDVSVPAPFAIAWFPLVGLATWALRREGASPDDHVPDEAMTGTLAALARILRPIPVALAAVALLAVITIAERPDGRLHLTVLDIGQGDAILIETPTGATMLVDGGPDPELTLRRLGATLPFHVRDLDLVVVSHPHQDHVGGLVDVLDRFAVDAVLEAGIGFENAAYDRLLADAAGNRIPVVLARAGQRLAVDPSTTVEILYPTAADAAAPLPEGDINNGSVVLLVRHGGFTAILTGDAEAPVEQTLVARGGLPDVDVLKVGHHGSHSSTTAAFVEALRPEVAVISSGVDNEYGHPAPETLTTLAENSVAAFRTDLHGDVEIVSDGRSYRVRTVRSGWGPITPVMMDTEAVSIGPVIVPTEQVQRGDGHHLGQDRGAVGDRRTAESVSTDIGRDIARTLSPDGFRWLKSRMAIVRPQPTSTQMVALEPASNPSYHPGAMLALHPSVIVIYPELDDLVAMPGVTGAFNSIGQPLRYGSSVRDDWYVVDPADAGSVATEISELIRSHALPLLNDVAAADGFLSAFERSDPRILWHDQVRIGVVAAYVARGDLDAARSLLAQRFRGPARHLLPPRLAQAVAGEAEPGMGRSGEVKHRGEPAEAAD